MSQQTKAILSKLDRTTDDTIGRDDLIERLSSGRKLRIKYGVDCTAPVLHIGHAVNLWMMRALQDLGHTVVFLLGDLTTQVGDPTGRSQTRPVLSRAEIESNAAAIQEQAELVLRTEPALFELRRNSEWYAGMEISELLGLFSKVTHAQLMARDMFRERVAAGREIALHELTYPVLQGYDSVAVKSDLTIVGTDQLFNEMMGRHYQQRMGHPPQAILTTTITPGLDGGPKQSKSLDNYVALRHSPRDKFGKLMSLPDNLVGEYLTCYTELELAEVRDAAEMAARGGRDARDAKLLLASAVVARYHGEVVAVEERQRFLDVFSGRQEPADIPELVVEAAELPLVDLLARADGSASRSELRRRVTQGGVALDGRKLTDPEAVVAVEEGAVLKTGKRAWHRLRYDGVTSAT